MTFVDAHLHVFSDDPARYPYDGRWGMLPQEPTPVEELIACMDANGVDQAVMVQGAAYLYDNRYMADCRARFPDLPNVSVKVSATPPWGRETHPDLRVAPLMRRVYEAFGAPRLLW